MSKNYGRIIHTIGHTYDYTNIVVVLTKPGVRLKLDQPLKVITPLISPMFVHVNHGEACMSPENPGLSLAFC